MIKQTVQFSFSSILKKVVLTEYDLKHLKLQEQQFQMPILKEDQFFARVHASTINPLDINKIYGRIRTQELPLTPGSECSGVIIEGPKDLIGRNVSFAAQGGSFANYAIGNLSQAIMLPSSINMDQAACGFINPMTCCGLYDVTKRLGAKAIINTAANSQLGQMIHRKFNKQLGVINLVRGEEKTKAFKIEQNARYVVDITAPDFKKTLAEIASKLNATVCLDCYSGPLTSQILQAMPNGSTTVIYGSLVQEGIEGLSAVNLRFTEKSIFGFTLFSWLKKCDTIILDQYKQEIGQNLTSIFKSNIIQKFPVEQVQEAVKEYENNMSAGKIILTMD